MASRYHVFICISLFSIVIFLVLSEGFLWRLPEGRYSPPISMIRNEVLVDNTSATRTAPKVILAWNSHYTVADFGVGSWGEKPFSTCPVTDCFFTRNKTMLKEASAVLFHAWRLGRIPNYRHPGQLYAFFLLESPYFIRRHKDPFLKNPPPFNVTMTYRRDSDIFVPVQHFYRLPKETSFKLKYPLSARPRLVAWVVSHCETASKREDYVKELKRYIDVDIYGKCGTMRGEECRPKHPECFTHYLPSQYKFYLSFENNVCRDYVTEKLYRILTAEIIPIVYGGTKYTRDSPPNSFVNIMDYRSPKALAAYLHRLAANETEYLRYLEWKKHYGINTIPEMRQRGFCQLCQLLHTPHFHKTYTQAYKWWSKDACELPLSWPNASWNGVKW